MASGSTPVKNIPYPIETDNVNVAQDLQYIAERTEDVLIEFENTLTTQGTTITNAISDQNDLIDETIDGLPALIESFGLQDLLGSGLTWGQLKNGTA